MYNLLQYTYQPVSENGRVALIVGQEVAAHVRRPFTCHTRIQIELFKLISSFWARVVLFSM